MKWMKWIFQKSIANIIHSGDIGLFLTPACEAGRACGIFSTRETWDREKWSVSQDKRNVGLPPHVYSTEVTMPMFLSLFKKQMEVK